jgi:mRNA-degrading endonuclease toxin of MazEF toxin-antitoxin module
VLRTRRDNGSRGHPCHSRNIPVEAILDRSDRIPVRCVFHLAEIATLPKILLKQRITDRSTEKIRQVDAAIRFDLNQD